ncbi:MAG: transglutaminase domain protein [Actinomycetia bacterium]|nr:transglutaminase domain protein [Actinomycetes bacterium]
MTARSHRQTIAAAIAVLAAAVSLYPLFIGTTWFWAGAGATVTVAVAGTLTRLRRLPLLACFTVGLLGLVCYLNLVFEAGHSFGHVLPTLNSLEHLGQLARAGVDESGKYAPPAPELPGIVLLGAGGIGIVALLVDFTAVRLRSAALAGAPLLLLVTEPFAVSAARGWLETVGAFCLGTVGYLGLLSAESRERIREWEQPRPGAGDGPDMSTLASAGRRVGAAAVVIALCLPVLIPGLHVTRLLGGKPGIGGNPGDGAYSAAGAGFPSPEVAMSSQLQEGANTPVLHYGAVVTSAGTSISAGKPAPEYLQLYVLDQFTAAGFQLAAGNAAAPLSNAGPTLPAAPGLPGNPLVTQTHSAWPLVSTSIKINPGVVADTSLNGQTAAVLPVPYPALSVTVPTGTWLVRPGDLMVYSTTTQVSGLSYGVISLDPTPTNQALEDAGSPPASIATDYGSVPSSYQGLTSLAQDITAAAPTEIDKARAIQAWLDSGAFTYTLKAPQIDSAAGLETFLQSTKRGYCQQFAVAMAVLARLVGIPSRVVVGYTSGTQQKDGSWLVRTHDAHEWPELYFAGSGWLRFEPTPSGADGAGTATEPAYTQEPTSTGNPGSVITTPNGSVPSAAPSAAKLPPGSRLGLPPVGEGGLGGTLPGKAGGLTGWQIFGLVMAGLLAVAVIAPSAARLAIRRRRWGRARRGGDAALAHAAWRELQDDLVDYQAGYAPSESPRATGTRLGTQRQLSGASFEALSRIALAEERAQYAASPVPGRQLRADSMQVRRALAASTSRAGRLRARLLPPSVLRYPWELPAEGLPAEGLPAGTSGPPGAGASALRSAPSWRSAPCRPASRGGACGGWRERRRRLGSRRPCAASCSAPRCRIAA